VRLPFTKTVVLVGIIAIIIPIPLKFVGEWTVRVTDYDNRPINDARVLQSWKDYTFGVSGEQNVYTDSEGKVVFAPQIKYGPLAYWAVKAVANVVGFGMHASFGTSGRVRVVEMRTLDPERRKRLAYDQTVVDALGIACGPGCNAPRIESHLHIPYP
jgi:hypothetical protein